MDEGLLGVALTTACVRAANIGFISIREDLCVAFATAFGYGSSTGLAIYQQIKLTANLSNTIGLNDSSIYNTYELSVYNIIDTAFPNESSTNKQILALSTNAMLFAYFMNSNGNLTDFVTLLGTLLLNVSQTVNGNTSLFIEDNLGIVVNSPFNSINVYTLLQNNYQQVLNLINTSPRDSLIDMVNYNWYDSSPLFHGPNLQTMKDVESQYYFISGKLIYQSDQNLLPDCIKDNITLNTISGIAQTQYIRNVPCLDNYIGPITGIEFLRIFSDGPASSGNFTDTIKNEYINLDKEVLTGRDYSSNNIILYSFITGNDKQYISLSENPIAIDGEGLYNIPQEYSNISNSNGCVTVQNMHIGGTGLREYCNLVMGECVGCYTEVVTGFKFVGMKLNENTWGDSFAYIQTNPPSITENFLSRALNINNITYAATPTSSGTLQTQYNNFGMRYLGYPQISGANILPFLAFYENFDNTTFNTYASITLFPCIGTSYGGSGQDSSRTYSISPILLVNSKDSTHYNVNENSIPTANFYQLIPSTLSGDKIFQQFFGMGNNFDNNYTILSGLAYNVGYAYTGYYLSGNDGLLNIISEMDNYTSYLLGSQAESIEFISGYTNGSEIYGVTQMYAQDGSGNLVPYYYLDNRNIPSNKSVTETEWTSFAPLPYSFESDNNFSRILSEQNIENYFPRFQKGPFSTITKKILYPNADTIDKQLNSKSNGFPSRIQFTLSIREEAVREIFGTYTISVDGIIDTNPTFIRIIRPVADQNGNGILNFDIPAPIMHTIFTPDSSYFSYQYDLNNFGINNTFQIGYGLSTMVDNDYAPSFLSGQASGKNSHVYDNSNNPFQQGIRLTGSDQVNTWNVYTGNGGIKTYYQQQVYNNGLFHYYNTIQRSGYLLYTPPIFNLESKSLYANPEIQETFGLSCEGANCYFTSDSCQQVNNSLYTTYCGQTGYVNCGNDLMYLEYVGGRSGYFAEQEGGYNSMGIIGDTWTNFSYTSYGMKGQSYSFGEPWHTCAPVVRWPVEDNAIIEINSTPDSTSLFTKALNYSPFIFDLPIVTPFNKTENYQYIINGTTGYLTMNFSGDFASIDLGDFLSNTNFDNGGFYNINGLQIGPFDRNIEVGVIGGNKIISNGNIYINNNQITDVTASTCGIRSEFYNYNLLDSGIIPGEFGRNNLFSIIDVVPESGYLNINISGLGAGTYGFPTHSILSFRPRKNINTSEYIDNIHSGEEAWVSPFYLLKNSLEQQFIFPHSGNISALEGQTVEITNYTRSGKLYPIPNIDFTGLGTLDSLGNLIYPPNANVETYWKRYASANLTPITVSGWREGSRISITITNVNLISDILPYQNDVVVSPSGACIISGSMGYSGQAEASIFSEGILLQDTTTSLTTGDDDYEPYFLSDVLNRLTFLQLPSGEFNKPILVAPSTMIQRENISIISPTGNIFNKLLNQPPQNYNKYLWPALSDLETLNPGETIEQIPLSDSNTFLNSTMLFSASQGQDLPNGNKNPNIIKQFDVIQQYQMYDSISTDALLNSGYCLTSGRGSVVRLTQEMISGALVADGMTLSLINLN